MVVSRQRTIWLIKKQALALKYVAVTMETILLWLRAYLVLRRAACCYGNGNLSNFPPKKTNTGEMRRLSATWYIWMPVHLPGSLQKSQLPETIGTNLEALGRAHALCSFTVLFLTTAQWIIIVWNCVSNFIHWRQWIQIVIAIATTYNIFLRLQYKICLKS